MLGCIENNDERRIVQLIGIKDLTFEQKDALDKIIRFLNSDDKEMLLSGYAGSGKTTLINVLLDYIDENIDGFEVTCSAPTNEAVRIVSRKSNRKFQRTIYGLLGLVLMEVDDDPPVLKQKGRIHINDYDLVIIDEASMINDDLYDRLQSYLNQYKRVKVLYSGDDAQLPPVNNGSDERGKNKPSKVFELENFIKLTEVKRVTENNPILRTVTQIRNTLTSNVDEFSRDTVHDNTTGTGIIFSNNKDFFINSLLNDFVSQQYKCDNDHVRALAYTNEEVNFLNNKIRGKIFGDDNVEYMRGENLIVDSPIFERAKNKKQVIIYDTGTRLRVQRAREVIASNCDFKAWELHVKSITDGDENSVRKVIRVVSADSFLMYKQVLKNLASQCKEAAVKSGGRAWFPYFEFKSQFDWVKYSYATTVHKSQGSTFRNVYVVENDINRLKWDNVERNKLKYVAFTRASHKLIIYNT